MKAYGNRYGQCPKVVCIGGGTGLSTMLRGIKLYTPNVTAIVTVSDDGGGSGVLREELGMLPPGDIRNCILALSNIEPIMRRLLSYRFETGNLQGQSFGNLFLAAMNGISDSFEEAVSHMGEVLAITGRVLPVSTDDVNLAAELDNGEIVLGETEICRMKTAYDCGIKRIWLEPENPKPLPGSIEAIEDADLIIFGPGSLYTSIISNLLVSGVAEAVMRSGAMKIYIANIMTQDGETEAYSVSDHIKELFKYGGGKLFDICLANSSQVPEDILEKYRKKDAEQIFADREEIERLNVKLFEEPILSCSEGWVRHNSKLLAREIFKIYRELSETREYRINR